MGHLALAQPASTLGPFGLIIDASQCGTTLEAVRCYSLQINMKTAVTAATFCTLETGLGRFFPIFVGCTLDVSFGSGTGNSFQMGTNSQGTQSLVNTTLISVAVGTVGSGQYYTTNLLRSDGTLRLSCPAGATVTYSVPSGSTSTSDFRTITMLGVYVQ